MKRTLLTFAVTFALACATHAGIYKFNKANALEDFVLHTTAGGEISFPIGATFEYRVYDVNDPEGDKAYMAQGGSWNPWLIHYQGKSYWIGAQEFVAALMSGKIHVPEPEDQ